MLAGIVLLLQLNGLIVAYKPPEARPNPGNTYLFKVKNRNTKKSVKNVQANNKNTRTTSVTPSGDFIANSEHISHICGKKNLIRKKKEIRKRFLSKNQEVIILENAELNKDGINLIRQDVRNAYWKRN